MDWKLPKVLQKSVDYFKPGTKNVERSPSPSIPEEEDDRGIRHVQHKGTVPFRRVECAVHTFVDVALPVDLDRLQHHQNNIKKWRKLKEFSKLQSECINAGRTVKQLTRNMTELENLRARVIAQDLPAFDKHLSPAKTNAMAAIMGFLSIQNEDLIDGLSENTNSTPFLMAVNTKQNHQSHQFETRNFSETDKNPSNNGGTTSAGFAHLKGNRLLISLGDQAQSFSGPGSSCPVIEDEDSVVLEHRDQIELVVEKQNSEIEECWKKLEKDIVELHEMMKNFSTVVHGQGEMVNDITNNIEHAEKNIKHGTAQLKKATILKAAMFPVLGAIIGGAVGGPIGLVAGFKLGSITMGFAAVGVTGTVVGYQGGKALKKRQEANLFEMKEIKKDDDEDNLDSFEVVADNRI